MLYQAVIVKQLNGEIAYVNPINIRYITGGPIDKDNAIHSEKITKVFVGENSVIQSRDNPEELAKVMCASLAAIFHTPSDAI